MPFSRELWIEQDDFREDPPKKFFRLAPGREVRLRGAYFVTCTGVEKDPATGEITTLRCTYDPATRGGDAADGRKVKATLHWVSAAHALDVEVRLYDRLFTSENPGAAADYRAELNPASLEVLPHCKLEPSVAGAAAGTRYQFERVGYFCGRSGFDGRSARLQPHGHAQGHLGEDRGAFRGFLTLAAGCGLECTVHKCRVQVQNVVQSAEREMGVLTSAFCTPHFALCVQSESASSGLIRAARRAGRLHAATATQPRTTTTAASTAGSMPVTP